MISVLDLKNHKSASSISKLTDPRLVESSSKSVHVTPNINNKKSPKQSSVRLAQQTQLNFSKNPTFAPQPSKHHNNN